MCGIFAITGSVNAVTEKNIISISRILFLFSESRGKESSGLCVSTVHCANLLRAPVPASKLITMHSFSKAFKSLRVLKEAKEGYFSILGHTRLVTNGDEGNNHNNQPILKHNITVIHNGIIVNHENLWGKYPNIKREFDVDTEIVPSLLNLYLEKKKSIPESIKLLFRKITGTATLGIHFHEFNTFAIASNNGTLYRITCIANGLNIFASESSILEKIATFSNKNLDLMFTSPERMISRKAFLFNLENGITKDFNLQEDNINYTSKKKSCYIVDLSSYLYSYKPKIMICSPRFSFKEMSIIHQQVETLRRCSRCVLPETMPFIQFDSTGTCNYCNNFSKKKPYGKDQLQKKFSSSYRSGKRIMIPFSGGRDSSYAIHYLVNELGLEPVTFCYDWGMVTDLARRNQARICGQLGLEHIVISADIKRKRKNIRKNILAWLKKPHLGMIPLFMAGDKHFFYHANALKKKLNLDHIVMGMNPFEQTEFKTGFCNVQPNSCEKSIYYRNLSYLSLLNLSFYYLKQVFGNPFYINASLIDTISAYLSYYFIPHNYIYLYNYIEWNEKTVNKTLINTYNWETAVDTNSTWRIGDGTAAFYNFIYYVLAGFTENDTFRSNQIRAGKLSRKKALQMVKKDNLPRFESINWYCRTIGLDSIAVIKKIFEIGKWKNCVYKHM